MLAGLVGATLAGSGAAYQGVFRNPLADPYLLGVAAGAGLGATIAIVCGLPSRRSHRSPSWGPCWPLLRCLWSGQSGWVPTEWTTLILAGVAVAAFLTALQTYVQQRNTDTLREVYAWILGRLSTVGWTEVNRVLPYVAVSVVVLWALRRTLDVLTLGDEEAASLGVNVVAMRVVIIVAASLGTAAVVAVSGLIGFVGIIVPHIARLVTGPSHRILLPVSLTGGAAFLTAADLVARTVQSGGEAPIGATTAFVGVRPSR